MSDRPEWVNEVVGGIADLRARLERIEGDLPHMRSDLMSRIDRLQDQLSRMLEDVGVNYASADRAIRAARAQREDINLIEEQLSALTRLVHKLQAEVNSLRGEH
ncbi:MAG TPA: hypothetical protein VD970_14340 [Acetobacteraceae bacterium]|nr:hypothetical protein [Acetobacteraceae bacterium]